MSWNKSNSLTVNVNGEEFGGFQQISDDTVLRREPNLGPGILWKSASMSRGVK
ncbi:hypothetical protein SAMN04488104_103040 [Algoriphagus faecimaris]|uniref:Uncharacterized protein n=1 Tax=Algoriphagus faecimaris TaxID=686796 RepID=A0A1G6UUI0_9BACT|nr:hypothetical protein [Algoriphagus faecimaris]SDD44904.1 hypothetical protein SAMN04488104_103040 [Algoriphagus faecimaris]